MAGVWLVMAASCHWGGTVYHQCRSIHTDGWRQGDTLSFELPAFAGQKEVEAFVDVRYTEEFPYQHLWLVVRNNVVDSLHWDIDTLCCALYDEKGQPVGKGLAGLYQVEIPLAVWSPDGSGCARVRIEHAMTDKLLKGVMDVGIRVTE